MTTAFNLRERVIIVSVRLFGPAGDYTARLALDTGATATMIRSAILVTIGYNLTALPHTVQFTSGTGVGTAPRVTIDKLEALGQERSTFPVVAHTLPPTATIDGLLGLDFFRNHILTLDFQNGAITLT